MESLKNPRHSDAGFNCVPIISRSQMKNARVLVVDDNHANPDAIKSMIKPYGIKIDCVDCGRKAVAAVNAVYFIYNAIFTIYPHQAKEALSNGGTT